MNINKRSRHIRGPISAVSSHLMSAGWTPSAPNDWRGPRLPTGEFDFQWTFPADALVSIDEAKGLLEDFQEPLAMQQRAAAEQHYCGS
eukprot:8308094-Pyramimonas_sp.AAC.1